MTPDYRVRVSEERDDALWDSFVASVPGGHHVQTSLWGRVKAVLHWRAVRVTLWDKERIVAGAQLLIRRMPLIGSVAYVTKGPLFTPDEPSSLEPVLREVCKLARNANALLVAIQPPDNCEAMATDLFRAGFRHSALELAPTASILIDLTLDIDCIIGQMKRQTWQNIRRSMREGVTVREGTQSDLAPFYRLYLSTGRHQQFPPYPEEYFAEMWRVLEPNGYIKLLMAEFGNEPVSALLLVPFADTVIAKILGWSGVHASRRPNDAVFWAAILWSKSHGYRYFDFEGMDPGGVKALLKGEPLPESFKHSPDFFKLGFGGKLVLYPDAYERVSNPIAAWAYAKASPKVGGESVSSKVLDYLRKR